LETRQWMTLPNIFIDHYGCLAVAVGNLILVIGDGTHVVEVLDTLSWTWSKLRNLPLAVYGCAGGLVGNQILIVGEEDQRGISFKSGMLLDLSELLPDVKDLPPHSTTLPEVPNVLDLGCQECKTELETWVAHVTTMKQESLAWIETASVKANKNKMMEKQVLKAEYAAEKNTLETMHEKNKERMQTEFVKQCEKVERRKRFDLIVIFAKKGGRNRSKV